MSTPTEAELWQDEFGGVDLSAPVRGPEMVDDNIPMIGPDLGNETPEEQTAPVQIMDNPPEPEADDEPISIQSPDGSTISIEKSSKGWKGSVDIGTGSVQVYYGKTKNELLTNVLTAQANATKKIREQNRKIKLGDPAPSLSEAVSIATQTLGRRPTADESFEIKTLFESDPDKALEKWFQMRTGRTVEEVASKADRGGSASNILAIEEANKEFLAASPTYYGDPNYANYNSLITYLAKHKLRRGRKTGDEQEILQSLVDHGHYTASNLEEAFEDLTEAGLLLSAKQPRPAAQPTPAAPANERIVRQETRPRAGFGIRPSETTQTRIEPSQPPTDKDLNNLTDAEIDAAIAAARQEYRKRR